MKHPVRSFMLAALAVATAASFASAAPETLRIDPNHSVAGFSIRHLFSRVNGRFNDIDGRLTWDAAAPATSSVDVTIPAATITTQNDTRDRDLRSDNFFDVAKYPTLTFKSTKVELAAGKTTLAEGDKFKVYGDLKTTKVCGLFPTLKVILRQSLYESTGKEHRTRVFQRSRRLEPLV